MAITMPVTLPVWLQVGDGERAEIGTVTLTPSFGMDGTATVGKAPIAALLHEVADEMTNPSQDDSASS